ncbi:DUF7674 family protein [Inconstantimicrobium mannanitabidum]|uniref:DUF7674 family protein n=1 Tax=Inconstantimicrobium mannanitabidum TaxID=1604901 RepID=UPI003CC60255
MRNCLGHVFFGDAINLPLTQLLKENEDIETIRRYIDFIEYMYKTGDEAVQNIVVVTILEYLGDDKDVLANAFNFFSDDIRKKSIEVERFLGRYWRNL